MEVKIGKKGLRKVLKEWEEVAMNIVWEATEKFSVVRDWKGLSSKDVYEETNKELKLRGSSISRASVINFLNAMCDYNVLLFTEETGKGGYHRIYRASTDSAGFMRKVIEDTIESFQEDYPAEVYAVVKDHYPTVR